MFSALNKSKAALAIGTVVIGLLLYFGFRSHAVAVDSYVVKSDHFAVEIIEEGKTRVKDRFTVSAPVPGFISRVELESGDPVAANQWLFTMQSAPADLLDARTAKQVHARLAAAEAAHAMAQAHLEAEAARLKLAESEYKRLQVLASENLVAKEQIEQAKTAFDTAQALVKSARLEVQMTAHQERDAGMYLEAFNTPGEQIFKVVAPINGSVLKRWRESEGIVAAGTPILDLGDVTQLEVEVDVLSSDAVKIKAGMSVRIDQWGGDMPLQGRVARVEPAGFTKYSALGVEEQRVWVIVDLLSGQNVGEMGDGYRVEANFVLWQADNVTLVPSSALLRDGEQWFVFVVEDGKAFRRPLTRGKQSGLWVEALAGVRDGDVLVRHPGTDMADGGAVTLLP